MTEDKPTAPPAIAPQSPTPRPDRVPVQGNVAVPPPPPSSVATDERTHQRYQSGSAGSSSGSAGSADAGTGAVTSTLSAMRKAAKKVTSVVTGEGGLETGATPVVGAPSGTAQPAQQPVAAPQAAPAAAQPAAAQNYAYGGTAAYGAAAQAQYPAQQQPQAQAQAQPPAQPTTAHVGSARRVRLVVSRVNPWSVMKMAFLLSIAIGIITVVAAAVVWTILNGLHLFANVNDLVESIVGDETQVNVLQYVAFSRTMSMSTLIAVANIVLITALSTLGAFLYNIAAALVGGVHVTLTDD